MAHHISTTRDWHWAAGYITQYAVACTCSGGVECWVMILLDWRGNDIVDTAHVLRR